MSNPHEALTGLVEKWRKEAADWQDVVPSFGQIVRERADQLEAALAAADNAPPQEEAKEIVEMDCCLAVLSVVVAECRNGASMGLIRAEEASVILTQWQQVRKLLLPALPAPPAVPPAQHFYDQWKCQFCGYGEWKNRSDWPTRKTMHEADCNRNPAPPSALLGGLEDREGQE